MRNKKILRLAECAVRIALAFALSYVRLWKMPLGGSITLCSMLPIMFIGIKHGPLWGLGTGFIYSLTQLFQGLIEGDVSVMSMSAGVFTVAVLFDYVVPFTVLGLSGIFGKRRRFAPYLGMGAVVTARFICHYLTGVTIWAQWTPDGWSTWIYSAAYNAGYLLPDLAICMAVAVLMLQVKEIRRLVGIRWADEKPEEVADEKADS